ncbi:MAG: Smr/MutS family protein [Thiomicrospira sp.]
MNEVSAEDKQLFAQAMNGVTPLTATNQADISPPKLKRAGRKPRFIAERPPVGSAHHTHRVSADEKLEFYQKGFRLQDLTRLRKRVFELDASLDLHGDDELSAQQRLSHFIQHQYQLTHRYLLVIHGKGHNAQNDYPILKNLVNQQLRYYKEVLAFTSALPKDGGTGAVYVLLKAH